MIRTPGTQPQSRPTQPFQHQNKIEIENKDNIIKGQRMHNRLS